jgi:hypothetical protein
VEFSVPRPLESIEYKVASKQEGERGEHPADD